MKKREEILADLYGDAFRAALEAGPAIHQGNLDTVLDMADRMVARASRTIWPGTAPDGATPGATGTGA